MASWGAGVLTRAVFAARPRAAPLGAALRRRGRRRSTELPQIHRWLSRCLAKGMSDDKGATEDKVDRISTIRGAEVLGYEGAGREEHSGANNPAAETGDLEADLADNEAKDL